ncbi:hypothetical protein [Aquabacterium sp.]|uniref:hypothetical protein n=1 Tax=Aquabacterium sp. TaxID=1872578 RepID=UPI002E34F459|nr:hypothetical protein [Aquabacterium sp.]HEX5310805.1 hypothetical protein [Aquabacterium sp.]
MKTAWNVKEARELIAEAHGRDQLELARTTIDSLAERQTYASYHFHEYRRILHEAIDAKLAEKSLLELTLPIELEEHWRIDNALTQASANAIACIQSLHAIMDTLAHTVCYAAGLNLGSTPIKERDVSLGKVIKALAADTDFHGVWDQLNLLNTDQVLQHLSALVNHSKHRRVLRPSLNVDLRTPSQQTYELEFPGFSHNGCKYPAVNADKMMEEAYSVLSPTVVACGNELNEALRSIVYRTRSLTA